jgi:uracil-DNA glycosylase family 4
MEKCNACTGVVGFHFGAKGQNADLTKLLVVMHKPDRRILQDVLIKDIDPYVAALLGSRAGESLTALLRYCGLSLNDIYLTNAFKCVLDGDRNPTAQEYSNCREVLEKQIEEFQPRAIISSGEMPYELLCGKQVGRRHYSESKGRVRKSVAGVPTLVLPHFSALCVPMASESEERSNFMAANDFVRKYQIQRPLFH